jgi:hypothetical protein
MDQNAPFVGQAITQMQEHLNVLRVWEGHIPSKAHQHVLLVLVDFILVLTLRAALLALLAFTLTQVL